MDFNIIYQDQSIVVVEKPSGIPSQADKKGDKDMITLLSEQLKNQNIGIIHRLDRPVGGVMVFSKTKQSNAQLSRQVQDKIFKKSYMAVVCGVPSQKHARLVDLLWKNERLNTSKVVCKGTNNAKEAILEYDLLGSVRDDEFGQLSLLRVDLQTGRHHQIRVQLSHANLPLWGDTKYNPQFAKVKTWRQIALWSERIEFNHPTTGKVCFYHSKPTEFPFSSFDLGIKKIK